MRRLQLVAKLHMQALVSMRIYMPAGLGRWRGATVSAVGNQKGGLYRLPFERCSEHGNHLKRPCDAIAYAKRDTSNEGAILANYDTICQGPYYRAILDQKELLSYFYTGLTSVDRVNDLAIHITAGRYGRGGDRRMLEFDAGCRWHGMRQ